jgi:hypothetical protein
MNRLKNVRNGHAGPMTTGGPMTSASGLYELAYAQLEWTGSYYLSNNPSSP